MPPPVDHTNITYNYLTGIEYTGKKSKRGSLIWLFRCVCGKEVEIVGASVKSGHFKSCGCQYKYYYGVDAVINHIFMKNYNDGDLTFEQFRSLTGKPCHWCDHPADDSNRCELRGMVWRYNGLDRIDHDLPHDFSNCVPSCWDCNQNRGRTPIDQWVSYLRRISRKWSII